MSISNNKKIKTKQQKREEIDRKRKIKEKKGGTLAGQVQRTRISGGFRGEVKKMMRKISLKTSLCFRISTP